MAMKKLPAKGKVVPGPTFAPQKYRHVNEKADGGLLISHITIGMTGLYLTIRGTHESLITCPTHADVQYLASVLMPEKLRVPLNDAATQEVVRRQVERDRVGLK